MSAIPPNLVGPLLQSPVVQGQAAALRDTEENQRSNADRRHTSAITEQDSTVETTDNDTQVHTDAEGSGSRGRAFTQKEDETETEEEPLGTVMPGDEGQNIDLEA